MLPLTIIPILLLAKNLDKSVKDNTSYDKIKEPAIGSVVYCELLFSSAEHSGIYIGDNKIVHLNGDGTIECVTPKVFLNRLNGMNTAISIYTSCKDGCSVGSIEAAERAKSMIGKRKNYNLLLDNCHKFTAGCLTNDFKSARSLFTFLKWAVRDTLDSNEWRIWDY